MLTRELAGRCGHLVAVEIDRELYHPLCDEFRNLPHVTLVSGDFLRFPLPESGYKVFASLPFNQTAAILRKLINAGVPPQDAYLVVQREAAERFAGGPYSPETLSSLLLNPWWHIEIFRRMRRTDFVPPPGVDSVLLWLARRTRPLIEQSQYSLYNDFMAATFYRGGQTIRQCLQAVFTERQIVRLTHDLRYEMGARPSTLSFDQWLGLFRYTTLEENEAVRSKFKGARARLRRRNNT